MYLFLLTLPVSDDRMLSPSSSSLLRRSLFFAWDRQINEGPQHTLEHIIKAYKIEMKPFSWPTKSYGIIQRSLPA